MTQLKSIILYMVHTNLLCLVTQPYGAHNSIDRWPPKATQDTHSGHLNDVIQTFNLTDVCTVLYPNQSKYTFKRKRLQDCTMSRIDRLLVSKHFRILSYEQSDCVQSDHEIIYTQVQLQSTVFRGRGVWKNNAKLYKKEDFPTDFKKLWELMKKKKKAMFYGNLKKWWNEAKYDIKMWLMNLSKNSATFERREVEQMKGNLDFLLQRFVQCPNNRSYSKEYFDFKKKLYSKLLRVNKEKVLRENAEKFLVADRSSKEFFETFKRRSDPSLRTISEMKDENGAVKGTTHEILDIGHKFYEKLFSKKELTGSLSTENAFFEGIKTVPVEFLEILVAKITLEEVEIAINSFLNGKTPGVDGLSIEFYKAVFPIIGEVLVKLFNTFFNDGFIPAKNKIGLISLIPKKEPYDEIENYRPINLLNVDLKIYTKILTNRMKPILPHLLHETQFSQPGKNIGQLIAMIRDLRHDMHQGEDDAFFVSVDFMKAFDNVDHSYIKKVLLRMEFPQKFINAFMSLYKNASSKLIINGVLSKAIRILSGLRQGDPLSKDIFTVAENPLIVFLNVCKEIQPYDTVSRQKFLTLAFVDDVNLLLRRLVSLLNALNVIENFGSISGFKINMEKTKGNFFNKKQLVPHSALPPIKWVRDVCILGVNFGSEHWENQQWEDKFMEFKKEIGFFKTKNPTLDAKSMLSKFKLGSFFHIYLRFSRCQHTWRKRSIKI